MSSRETMFVTRPYLPSLEEFIPYLEEIWESRYLSNGGPFHTRLEAALSQYFGVEHISLVANGTIALSLALRALDISGEVITTPYSFVATSHVLKMNAIDPVFVDICEDDFSLDPKRIEDAITSRTTGIMPVHCYGNPCDVKEIEAIADRHGLKVVYDAAHAFGVKKGGTSILNRKCISTLSFHATKVFNTFEGGAIISPDKETKMAVDRLKNFGFENETTVSAVGGNGKMSEFNSAIGLLQMKYIDEVIAKRQIIDNYYRMRLADLRGVVCPTHATDVSTNFGYFPILVGSAFPVSRDCLYAHLKKRGIFARRYFYPLITEFPMYRHIASARPSNLPNASRIAAQVLCLPIYPDLSQQDQDRVLDAIREVA